MRRLRAYEAVQLLIPCGKCDAEPGAWCTTRSGVKAQNLHSNRYWDTRVVRDLMWWEESKRVLGVVENIAQAQDPSGMALEYRKDELMMLEVFDERLAEAGL